MKKINLILIIFSLILSTAIIKNSAKKTETESIEEDISNDLKEFGVDSDANDLFSSETENLSSDDLLSSSDDEDDDLEIPAFLRRQKNEWSSKK